MFKTILVGLTGIDSDAAALQTAFLAGRPFDAHLECLHVRPGPGQMASLLAGTDMPGGMDGEVFKALRQQDEMRTQAARRSFDEFVARLSIPVADSPPGPKGVSAAWEERLGDASEETIAQARFHDLLVVARAADSNGLSPGAIGSILIGCGRPVLLAPGRAPENLAPTVAIAWKESAEAARAVTASMPFLQKASRIFVLSAAEGGGDAKQSVESAERLRNQLRWHGLTAEAHSVAAAGRELPDAVMETARDVGADMLAMGAYGHSRLRELVLGGFTRHVIAEARLPVLLFH